MADVQRVAMLGGTFNPVHIGHLRAAIELREVLSLDRLHMIVNRQPPHRDAPNVSGDDRLAMLSAAVEPLAKIVADARELDREGPSYSVETLASLRADYGASARVMMVVGVDAFMGLASWYQPERLFELAHIVVIARPGALFEPDAVLSQLLAGREATTIEAMMKAPAGQWLSLDLPTAIMLSSTTLRAKLAACEDIRYLLPREVEQFIHAERLY